MTDDPPTDRPAFAAAAATLRRAADRLGAEPWVTGRASERFAAALGALLRDEAAAVDEHARYQDDPEEELCNSELHALAVAEVLLTDERRS